MKKKIFLPAIYLLIIVSGLLMIIHFIYGDIKYNAFNQSKLRKLEFIGSFYTNESSQPQNLTMEALEKAGTAEYLTVKGHINGDIEVNEQMFIYLQKISVEVYKNGEFLYEYGGKDTHLSIVRSSGNVWGNFFSNGIKAEDEIMMKFHNPYPNSASKAYVLCIQRLYAGDKLQLFLHIIKESNYMIIICMLIFLIGAELLFIAYTLKFMKVKGVNPTIHCGVLFLLSSGWILLDSSYITLILPYGMTLDMIDTMLLIGTPIAALHYGKNYTETRVRTFFSVLEIMILIGNMIYLTFQVQGIWDSEIIKRIFMQILPIILIFVMLCLIYEIWKNRDTDSRLVLGAGLVLVFFAGISYIRHRQDGVYGSSYFGIGLVVYALIQYVIVMRRVRVQYLQAVRAREMEKQLMESRISIMLSQIQPHFLYNSISSIQELCLTEPQSAYDALAKFAHFLRGNMDSITTTNLIPFEQELRHVNNYLSLEKIRFEDRLSVEYEIKVGGFLVPSLTLQPIVENAVRHGISKKKRGGTVRIATERIGNEIVITVSDDGEGFDTSQIEMEKDGRSHVGMENVRIRLKNRCDGSMEVYSSSEGTTVKIRIPEHMN